MRKVNRNWDNKPTIFATPAYKAALVKLIKEGKNTIEERFYKNSVQKNTTTQGSYSTKSLVLEKLNVAYHHKCAYCESRGQHDIEHYRPKKKVKEASNHSGYYWLAYEWSNLIPSCIKCNREGGKYNKFDVLGNRVMAPPLDSNQNLMLSDCLASSDSLIAEIPKLLHPELDDPKTYFYFDLENINKGFQIMPIEGIIEIADTQVNTVERAAYTITTCKLNREPLCLDRWKVIEEGFVKQCKDIFNSIEELKVTHRQLILMLKKRIELGRNNAEEETREHTLLWWYVMNNKAAFNKLIVSQFQDNNQRETIEAVYDTFYG